MLAVAWIQSGEAVAGNCTASKLFAKHGGDATSAVLSGRHGLIDMHQNQYARLSPQTRTNSSLQKRLILIWCQFGYRRKGGDSRDLDRLW